MLSFGFNRDFLAKYPIYETLTTWDSFAQWRYSNQWSNREVLLLLVENYTQYPAISTWNIVVIGNFWRLIFEQLQLASFHYPMSWLKSCEFASEKWTLPLFNYFIGQAEEEWEKLFFRQWISSSKIVSFSTVIHELMKLPCGSLK